MRCLVKTKQKSQPIERLEKISWPITKFIMFLGASKITILINYITFCHHAPLFTVFFIYGVALTPEVQLIFYAWYIHIFFTILSFYLILKCEIFHRVWIFIYSWMCHEQTKNFSVFFSSARLPCCFFFCCRFERHFIVAWHWNFFPC